jgi:hypothetical protein
MQFVDRRRPSVEQPHDCRSRTRAGVSATGSGTLGWDEERKRRSGLLLLDEGGVPARLLGAPITAGLDDWQQRGAAPDRS